MNDFQNKVAIVTGGGSGIGRSLCKELAIKRKAKVIVVDINEEKANDVVSEILKSGRIAEAFCADVRKESDIKDMIQSTVTKHDRIDYMFNNAGVTFCGEVRDAKMEHWHEMFNVNFWGTLYGTLEAYRVMADQGFGHIINVCSLDGLSPMPMSTPYTAAKHAVVGLSTALRIEAARLNVNVTVACPAAVKTNIFHTSIYAGINREKAIEAIFSGFKMISPEDCARAILRGVKKNKAIILDGTVYSRIFWWIYRLHPTLTFKIMGKMIGDMKMLKDNA